jgi:hypothetical protein
MLLNLLVLPGWGSFKAGRRWSGVAQLVLGLAGALVTVAALYKFWVGWLHSFQTETPLQFNTSLIWWVGTGVVVFFISWFWALGTSIQLLRQASK